MPADWVVDGNRPVAEVADEVLQRLGWSTGEARSSQD